MDTKLLMNDLRSYSRLWLTEFMEIYRNEECLWQGKHPDYSNHAIRNASYDKLVEKLKEVEPNPDRAMVVRKINSLRSAFRREYRKKMNKDNYESRLWYFEKLMFIADQNPKRLYNGHKREIKINFDDDSMDYEQEEESDKNEIIQAEEAQHIQLIQEPIRCHVIKSENTSSDSSQQQQHQQQQQQQREQTLTVTQQQQPQSSLKVLDITSLDVNSQREIQQAVDSLEQQHQQQVQQQMHNVHQGQTTQLTQIHHQQVPTIQIAREHLPALFNSTTTFDHPRQNDEFDAVGTNVASKLRSMNQTQRIIAEKVISDILFNGQLGSLSISSSLAN